mmetsp:Transcript_22996/g.52666  ORF Transcript_22996/g.52666 Transcript_22996/m.52666 type:complete len:138 (-) Transcript_22996:110-523(-)
MESRESNFFMTIEGKWNEGSLPHKRERVKAWVAFCQSALLSCWGVRSTAHPEAVYDNNHAINHCDELQMSNARHPAGWYNFESNGERLDGIKQKFDPHNIFSIASRISYPKKKNATYGGSNHIECHENDDKLFQSTH